MFLSDDAFLNLLHSLMKLSASTVTEGDPSGATKMLLDICVRNCHRLHLFVDSVCSHTSKLIADNRAGVRLSAVSVLADIIAAAFNSRQHPNEQIAAVEAVEFAGQTAAIGYILPPVEVVFLPAVRTKERILSLQSVVQQEMLDESALVLALTRVLSQTTVIADASDAVLASIMDLVEQTGQQLTQGWGAVFAVLTSVACARFVFVAYGCGVASIFEFSDGVLVASTVMSRALWKRPFRTSRSPGQLQSRQRKQMGLQSVCGAPIA